MAGAKTENGSFDSPCEPCGGSYHAPAYTVIREGEMHTFDIISNHPTVEREPIMAVTIHGDDAQIISAILAELEKANEKHGPMPENHIEAAAVVAEESGELIRAALHHKFEKDGRPESELINNMITESIQTGAMAIKMIQSLIGPAKAAAEKEKNHE